MRRISPRVLAGVIFGLVATALLVGFQLQPDVPPLKDARPVLSLAGTNPFYWWLTTDEILLVRSVTPISFARYKVASKTETPLPDLDAVFQKSNGHLDTIRISPDGKYLLWSAQDRKKTIVATVEGKTFHETIHKFPTFALWYPDNQHWAGFDIQYNTLGVCVKYDKRTGETKDRGLPLSATVKMDRENVARAILSDTGVFLVQSWEGPDKHAERAFLGAIGFGANPMRSRTFTYPAPYQDNEGLEVLFAPNEMQMGWVVRFQQPLQRTFGMDKRPLAKFNTGLWVTDRKTNTSRSLGYLPTIRDNPNSGPYNVQFTADAKGISYVYNNTLYIIPVPQQ